MANNNDHKQTLVEKHAMKRLHKVEKERRKPYIKSKKPQPKHFNWQGSIMLLILLIVLFSMMLSII